MGVAGCNKIRGEEIFNYSLCLPGGIVSSGLVLRVALLQLQGVHLLDLLLRVPLQQLQHGELSVLYLWNLDIFL